MRNRRLNIIFLFLILQLINSSSLPVLADLPVVASDLNIPTIQQLDVYLNSANVKITWLGPISDESVAITDYAYNLGGGWNRMNDSFSFDGYTYSYTLVGLGTSNTISIAPVQNNMVQFSSASVSVQLSFPKLGPFCTFAQPVATRLGWETQITANSDYFALGNPNQVATTLSDNLKKGQVAVFTHYDKSSLPSFSMTAAFGASKPMVVGPDSSGRLIIEGLRPGQLFGLTLISTCANGPLTIWGNAQSTPNNHSNIGTQSSSGYYGTARVMDYLSNQWIRAAFTIKNESSKPSIPNCRVFAQDRLGNLVSQDQAVVPVNYQVEPGQSVSGEVHLPILEKTDIKYIESLSVSCI